MLEAANFVAVIEKRQGLKVSCVEEIAYRLGYINANQLAAVAESLGRSDYGRYLHDLIAAKPI